jgi:hypothetical protein
MNLAPTDAEQLLRLEMLVPLCESIRKGTEFGTALAQAQAEVQRAAILPDSLERLQPIVEKLRETPYLPSEDVGRELAAVTKAGRALERCVDTETLKDARFEVKGAQESLQRLEAMISKAWNATVQAEFGALQRLGAVLAGIPDTKSAGAELQTWAGQVLTLADGSPPSAQSLQLFDTAKEELGHRFEALGQLGIDTAVRSFLVAVAGRSATVANLTTEVLQWLIAKNAQSRFRIELL